MVPGQAVTAMWHRLLDDPGPTAGPREVVMPDERPLDMTLQEKSRVRMSVLVRKLGHFASFALFALLLVRSGACRGARGALLVSVGLAVATEMMQYFAPFRSPGFLDVFLDMSGAVFGLLCSYRRKSRT